MKTGWKLLMIFLVCFGYVQNSIAQATWGSYARSLSAKGYEGKRFKLQADIKTAVEDDSASARLWVRVDKTEGTGFFNNMWKTPVRSTGWKTYSIDGKIDATATRLYFGALAEMNGRFYFDNFKITVETAPGKWETVYSDDFEKNLSGWSEGIGMADAGINKLYKTSLQTDGVAKSKVLLM